MESYARIYAASHNLKALLNTPINRGFLKYADRINTCHDCGLEWIVRGGRKCTGLCQGCNSNNIVGSYLSEEESNNLAQASSSSSGERAYREDKQKEINRLLEFTAFRKITIPKSYNRISYNHESIYHNSSRLAQGSNINQVTAKKKRKLTKTEELNRILQFTKGGDR